MALSPACLSFIPMLSPFVDGELLPNDRVTVERHLAVCRDCTGRVADLRAESGLIRHGLDLAADEVDFKDFATQVMARLTPYKPPVWERVRISFSEMFLYQRKMMLASMAGAAAVLAIAVPTLILGKSVPDGYAREMMAVQSVTTEAGAKVTPVVMTSDKGDAIIWMVSTEQQVDPSAAPAPQDQGKGAEGKKLDQEKPKGGEL